ATPCAATTRSSCGATRRASAAAWPPARSKASAGRSSSATTNRPATSSASDRTERGRFRTRSTARGLARRGLLAQRDAETAHLLVQVAALEPEVLGGAAHVPFELRDAILDDALLEAFEQRVERTAVGDVAAGDLLGTRQ